MKDLIDRAEVIRIVNVIPLVDDWGKHSQVLDRTIKLIESLPTEQRGCAWPDSPSAAGKIVLLMYGKSGELLREAGYYITEADEATGGDEWNLAAIEALMAFIKARATNK